MTMSDIDHLEKYVEFLNSGSWRADFLQEHNLTWSDDMFAAILWGTPIPNPIIGAPPMEIIPDIEDFKKILHYTAKQYGEKLLPENFIADMIVEATEKLETAKNKRKRKNGDE